MKKITLLIASILLSTLAFAQTVVSPTSDLAISIKSVAKNGSDVEIITLLTNKSASEVVVNLVGGQYQTGMSGSVAFDNEGNIYELGDVLVAIGKKAYTEQYCGVSVPAGVAVKCRICIKDVDSAANTLSKIKLCVLCPELSVDSTGMCFELNDVKFQ